MQLIEFHPDALQELLQACSWYEEQAPSLGGELAREIERDIQSIQKFPHMWPLSQPGIRRFFVHRFPFSIIYRTRQERLQIIAVMHLKRKPGYWKNRNF